MTPDGVNDGDFGLLREPPIPSRRQQLEDRKRVGEIEVLGLRLAVIPA